MIDQEYRFAARSGKTTLYKFRPYQTEEQREWVRQTIVDHKVYFSRASQLNDLFDMSPRLEIFTRENLLAAAEDYWLRHPEAGEKERVQQLEHLRKSDLKEYASTAQDRIRKRIENNYSVFSLAGNRDHPMLWSHYALGHTGLCIHFRADERSIFGASLEVIYDDHRPLVPIDIRSISEHEIFQRVTLRKGKFWAYEEEYRWTRYPDTDYSDLPIRFDGQYAYFPSSLLSGITVGARMPASDVGAVLKLAAAHNPRLPVWRAKETQSFVLEFELIG